MAPRTTGARMDVGAALSFSAQVNRVALEDFERHDGIVRLTRVAQSEPEARCAITLPRLHSAIGSPPRLGRSGASTARRDGVPMCTPDNTQAIASDAFAATPVEVSGQFSRRTG